MLNQLRLFLFAFILLINYTGHTQNTSDVYFKSGRYTPKMKLSAESFSSEEVVNGNYYRLICFDQIPTLQEKEELKNQGICLLNYVPRNAYFASISTEAALNDLNNFGINNVEPILSRFKLSEELHEKIYPHWTLFGENHIELNCMYFKNIPESSIIAELERLGAEILRSNSANIIRIRIAIESLSMLYASPGLYYFESLEPPSEPENLDGRTDHRSNVLSTDYNSGLKYDGTGVTVMMQDDGFIGDHIDYEGRVDQTNCSGCSYADANNHGDHVAGTIMGAGNLNPKYKGMAFGASLLVFNSNNDNYDDVPNLYATQELVITSKSYSDGCNAGYDTRAHQLDQQTHELTSLLHVFSAGNSGASDCGYGAGVGWGNITGGHKSGKNVIAVGNLTATDDLNSSSSRGPAKDGRIKPDICSVGTSVISTISDYAYESKTGTSMACPGVAGTIAQLYHAYKDVNGGANPSSGLIKAALLNTAEDLGNPGPDFKFGWGRINGGKAHALISQGNYIASSINQSGNNSHNLTIPAGVSKLKIMLYWMDYEGITNATIALVNDLNMQVIDPAMVSFNPWVLNPFPNAVTLNDVAIRTVDNLNNMEQVTIDSPLPGAYSINIDGFSVPEGPQEYFIVYEFDQEKVNLTYPLGGEGFYPGTTERIRWDASEGINDFTLEYSLDNGGNWTYITTAPANVRYATWLVPNTLTGQARIRVTRNSLSDESDDVFSIIRVPANLDFAWSCPDSLMLVWDSVPGATSYELYMLGSMYMDSIGTSTDTNFVFMASANDENWFSVRAMGPNGARSERAVAVRKLPGQFGCSWSPPFAEIGIICDSISSTECTQVLNESINVDANSTYLWYFPTGTPSSSTDENPTVCFSSSGYQNASLVVTNSAGTDSAYFANFVFVQGSMDLPYHEGFENMITFNGQENWSTYNPDVNNTFTITTSAALSGNKSARLLNHGQAEGSVDELISGPINLSLLDALNDTVTLSFRYAHRRRDDLSDDWLRVYAKSTCDDSWSLKKTLHGIFLSTLNVETPWTPSAPEDWTTVHITNITPPYFTGDFRFKFNFENGNGNNFFLDDINMYSGGPSEEVISSLSENNAFLNVNLFPNPTEDELNVRFELLADGAVNIAIYDVAGKVSQSHKLKGKLGSNLAMIDTHQLEAGVYFIRMVSEGMTYNGQFVIK